MFESVDFTLVDWSRAQFALTAIYHWLFVPLTLGLSFIIAIMESLYVKTGNEEWKKITKFWMTLFGINFAIGVATGIILEFEFGTNWSNYSWFVGDIFGAPLAIEGILAFFLESTFVAVMFFGWNKVSRKFHLISTWLVAIGANLSALSAINKKRCEPPRPARRVCFFLCLVQVTYVEIYSHAAHIAPAQPTGHPRRTSWGPHSGAGPLRKGKGALLGIRVGIGSLAPSDASKDDKAPGGNDFKCAGKPRILGETRFQWFVVE